MKDQFGNEIISREIELRNPQFSFFSLSFKLKGYNNVLKIGENVTKVTYSYLTKIMDIELMLFEDGILDEKIILMCKRDIDKVCIQPLKHDGDKIEYRIIGEDGKVINHECPYDIELVEIIRHKISIKFKKIFKAMDWVDKLTKKGNGEVDYDF